MSFSLFTSFRKIKVLVVVGMLFAYASQAWALTCQQVRTLTGVYLKSHFTYDTFDDVLSERTLENFIKAFDPGKLYFYDQDVISLRKKYAKELDNLVMKGDCKSIDEFINVFKKRFKERQEYVTKLIREHKFNFTEDEYIQFDRKKMGFAVTQEELDDRWRKRVKFQLLQLKLSDVEDEKAKEKLLHRYKIIVDQHNSQTIDQIYGHFLNAFATALDPHSSYMPVDVLEDFRINTKLSLEGIGAVLRSEDGFTSIQSLVPGGAAANSKKLQAGDKIIAVGQGKDGVLEDVIDMDLREVVKKIRGTKGTTVLLSVLRDEGGKTSKFVVPLVREEVQLKDRQAKSNIFNVEVKVGKDVETHKIGVVDLPSFYVDFQAMHENRKDYRSSSRDLSNEIKKLEKEGIDALIVDLRSNGGGSLEESIKVSGLFVDGAPVVQIKDVNGQKESKDSDEGAAVYKGPLVLMIGRQSASASEILAGAIKDYERGLIVGDAKTFGKGTVQNLTDLGYKLGATKVTISKFYRPSGASTQLKGVESDITLPSFADAIDIGEEFYDYALAWDKIEAVKYPQLKSVAPHLPTLKKRSAERIAKSAEFKKVLDDIAEYKKKESNGDKVSLNLNELKKEKEKEEKDNKKKNPLAAQNEDDPDAPLSLDKDIQLQEALRIAADYQRLLKKQKLGSVELSDLKKAELLAKEANNKAGKASKEVASPVAADLKKASGSGSSDKKEPSKKAKK